MINLTLRLRNGEAREVQAYEYRVLAIHKSPFEKGLWQLTHMPTSETLATAKTKKKLAEIATCVNAFADKNLDREKWRGSDPLEIFIGNDGESHRERIKKICGRA